MFTFTESSRDSVDMDRALQSSIVQRALPDLAALHATFGFDSFLASPPPTITSDPKSVREHLRGYAVQLERHERFTDLWKHQYANQLVNLRQLITTFDTRRQELEEGARNDEVLAADLEKRLLGLPEFEDLYYFLACKTRTLYSDLQLRFVSNFITMDSVLHCRGCSSYARAACTVRDIRNFLRAIWFHLLHPVVVRTIEISINHRKYQVLKANPLLPSWNIEYLTPEEYEKLQKYELGLNLDASTMGDMFEHLDDVSALSIPALLMKVSARGLGLQDTPLVPQSSYQSSDEGSSLSEGMQPVVIGHQNEPYLPKTLYEAELENPVHREKPGHARSKSDNLHSGLPGASRRPIRKSYLVPRDNDSLKKQYYNRKPGTVPSNDATEWPDDRTHGRHSVHPRRSNIQDRLPVTPEANRKSAYSLPTSPSSYRIPFHGGGQFPHDPPTPPPKSASQLARARDCELEARIERIERMERETSRLQEALQQVQILQRENSQLQERLSFASSSSPPKGLFRRLSKARSRSPGKSYNMASAMGSGVN